MAGGVIAGLLALTIGSLTVSAFALSSNESVLLGSVFGAAVGAVATYLGGRGSKSPPPGPPYDQDEMPR